MTPRNANLQDSTSWILYPESPLPYVMPESRLSHRSCESPRGLASPLSHRRSRAVVTHNADVPPMKTHLQTILSLPESDRLRFPLKI